MNPQSIIDRYRKEIYRLGWRVQYKSRVTHKREVPIISESFSVTDFTAQSDSQLFTRQLINSLPSDIEKTILYELYINDRTEAQVARQLQMSQQAVSKWKRKALQYLSQTANL
ncbi:sigma factor-like helix-turn-helix DNA-binding protein [Cohnella kolymensis]|uniref:sigma factor-like helix-turn-helix DNA-binding protein n=1 Tax=Cohnella kolymensis TaxID=1590652 RepID=UPI000ADC3AB4|nr:sigma factor-like helix-turn-helix DNA-binding protein [Cohnella kolymensis]